ncbi:hypothetical protein [Piscinibacterium candidicorallinum]|uniref:Uncharacterized protein n=1 Tax=Piscinibacterium candidicorallinum TaxID=1793872 RepID=A0ABV7H3F2_9BURK
MFKQPGPIEPIVAGNELSARDWPVARADVDPALRPVGSYAATQSDLDMRWWHHCDLMESTMDDRCKAIRKQMGETEPLTVERRTVILNALARNEGWAMPASRPGFWSIAWLCVKILTHEDLLPTLQAHKPDRQAATGV